MPLCWVNRHIHTILVHIYIYIHAHNVYKYIIFRYIHTYVRTYLHTYVYVRTYMYMYVRTHIYIRVYYSCAYVRTYIHTHNTYVHTHVRASTHKELSFATLFHGRCNVYKKWLLRKLNAHREKKFVLKLKGAFAAAFYIPRICRFNSYLSVYITFKMGI
jgi:hypothetical protein